MKKVFLYIAFIFNGLLIGLHLYNQSVNYFAFPKYCSSDPCLTMDCMQKIKNMFLYNTYVFLSQSINVISFILIVISIVYILYVLITNIIKKKKTILSIILILVCIVCGFFNIIWYSRGKCHQEMDGLTCKIVCPDSIFMKEMSFW